MRPALITFATLATALLSFTPAGAVEQYPTGVSDQFLSWCTTDQGQPESVSSCAIRKAPIEIPAAAMASFLSAAEGGGMTSTTQGVASTSVQIIATCVTGSASGGATCSSLLKSLGTSLGQ
jgi:hypothetical protein